MTVTPRRWLTTLRTVLALVLAALIFALPTRGALSQQRETVSLAEYQARLEQARSQIAAAEQTAGADGQAAQQAVAQAAADLDRISSVRLPNNTRVSLSPLVLTGDTPAQAIAHIDLVLWQMRSAAADDAAARLAALDRVLAGAEFSRGGGFLEWLRRLFGGGQVTDAADTGGRVLDTILSIVAGLILIFVLGRIVQAALGSFLREAEIRREDQGSAPVTVAAARRRAADLAQAGSYREAVRQLYLATLLSLEDRGLLRIDRSLTNREVLASVGQWQEVQQGLRPVVDTFEAVWYGEREPDRQTFERCSTAVQAATDLIAVAPSAASPKSVEAA